MSLVLLAATTLGLGCWPWGPGSLTSAAVGVAAYLVGPPGPVALLLASAATAVGGAYAAGAAERELGPDAASITIDEAAGMLLALAAAPRSAAGFALAFLLFRVFDIVKPPPLLALHRLSGGLGVVADDVAAGLYAAALLLLGRLAAGLLGLDLPWLTGTS